MDEPLVTETRFLRLDLPPEGLRLEKGGVLPRVDVAYETCGTLSPAKDNVVFICHALTGDAHVAGVHRGDRKPTGWWYDMVRPGGGIDGRDVLFSEKPGVDQQLSAHGCASIPLLWARDRIPAHSASHYKVSGPPMQVKRIPAGPQWFHPSKRWFHLRSNDCSFARFQV